jgi:predicted nucleotidyltransferase
MGTQLTQSDERIPSGSPVEAELALIPWLDAQTARLVRAIVAAVAVRQPELVAAILIGSVARHEERPLNDSEPSDVDLLLLFDFGRDATRLSYEQRLSINHSIGFALDRYLDAPREVQTILAVRDLGGWDPLFITNVAREGIMLWARGPLHPSLAPVAGRTLPSLKASGRKVSV